MCNSKGCACSGGSAAINRTQCETIAPASIFKSEIENLRNDKLAISYGMMQQL